MKSRYLIIILFLSFLSCKSTVDETNSVSRIDDYLRVDSIPNKDAMETKVQPVIFNYDTSQWMNIKDLEPEIQIDIRYATENNFTNIVMYDCGKCFLRPEVAKAIVKINEDVQLKGFGGIKLFDCYRPRPYQQRLWDKVPDPRFVSHPSKGSMHTRGAAVDLTIIDKEGNELDMGTDFDFFGREAFHNYPHNDSILYNRSLLKSMMYKRGFKHISSEWWHYSYTLKNYVLSDWVWECNNG